MSQDYKLTKKMETSRLVKGMNTLLGIVAGMVSDGDLNDTEIKFLKTWCNEHADLAGEYPANIIFRRVHEVLLDGVITPDERSHLLHELTTLSGNDFANTGAALPEHIANIFDDDPMVIFESSKFVFTGKFLFGTRTACENAVVRRGGTVGASVTNDTNYLVVGAISSPDWITANFGRKIQKAAEMAQSGDFEIAIIREVDWASSLGKQD